MSLWIIPAKLCVLPNTEFYLNSSWKQKITLPALSTLPKHAPANLRQLVQEDHWKNTRPKSNHLCHHQSDKFAKSRAALGPTSTWKKTWWSRVTWNVFKTYYIYISLYIHLEQPSTSMLHALILQPIDMRCFFWRNEWRMNHEWITNDWRMNEDFAGPLILSSHNRINRSTSTIPRPAVQ